MHYTKIIIAGIILIPVFASYAENQKNDFDSQVQKILTAHYNQYKDLEYFSGGEVSVYIPNQSIKNYYIGNTSHNTKKPAPVNADTLFEIGSITKSFTSAIILQLEKEGKLSLNDSVVTKLPQYSKWSAVTLRQLLNMTSGIPNYTDTPLLGTQLYYNLSRVWTDKELIDLAYPPGKLSPPLKSGFFYSNTNYILAALIIENATHKSLERELQSRILTPVHLNNTYYVLANPEAAIQNRLAHGYAYNQYDNPAMLGKDISEVNLSWAAGAGGLISNSEDIIKWVKSLLIEDRILNRSQQSQLKSLVSQTTGQPITQTVESDAHGFGLGVAQIDASNKNKDLGKVWFYEGETLGFRAIYWYKECNGVILSATFNSATNSENDHIDKLLEPIYHLLTTQYPQLNCID